MSALPPKADIRQRIQYVCLVPIADIRLLVETSAVDQQCGSLIISSWFQFNCTETLSTAPGSRCLLVPENRVRTRLIAIISIKFLLSFVRTLPLASTVSPSPSPSCPELLGCIFKAQRLLTTSDNRASS